MGNKNNINQHLLKGIIELGVYSLQNEGYSFSRGAQDIKRCRTTPGKYLLDLEYLDVCTDYGFVGEIDSEKISMAIHNSSAEVQEKIFNYNWDVNIATELILSATAIEIDNDKCETTQKD